MDFTGQHVVITGGSSGIGRATANKIVSLGGNVSLIARSAEKLSAAAGELGESAAWFAADVGDQAALLGAIDRAVAHHGPIDALFLNAATEGMFGPTPDYTDAAFETVMRVNVHSPFWAIRHLLPAMQARGKGSILITGSVGGETGMAGNIGYCASKHAVSGMAQCIALEVAASGVRCNCLTPGFIDTEMLADTPPEFRAAMVARVPQRRIGTPAEAANVAAFLLSDDASHVTAQTWSVDGGLLGTLPM